MAEDVAIVVPVGMFSEKEDWDKEVLKEVRNVDILISGLDVIFFFKQKYKIYYKIKFI